MTVNSQQKTHLDSSYTSLKSRDADAKSPVSLSTTTEALVAVVTVGSCKCAMRERKAGRARVIAKVSPVEFYVVESKDSKWKFPLHIERIFYFIRDRIKV